VKAFRFHYTVLWLLLLVLAQWRLGGVPNSLDFALAGAMQALSFPAGILAAVMLLLVPVNGLFWDTRWGSAIGWAVLFGAGFLQWFVAVPWFVRLLRRNRADGVSPEAK